MRTAANRKPAITAVSETAESMAEIMRGYIAARLVSKEISPETAEQYRKRVTYIETRTPEIAAMDTTAIQRKHVIEVRESFRETPSLANAVLVVLTAALAWAADLGKIPANPAHGVKGFRRECKRRKDLSRDEARGLIQAGRQAALEGVIQPEDADFFESGLVLGWRQHELKGMRTIDVDPERSMARPAHKGEQGRRKWKPIGPEMLALFQRRAAAVKPGEYLFGGPQKWDRSKAWRIWQNILPFAEALGVDTSDPSGPRGTIRPHITRSGNIDEKNSLGASLDVIAESVNHSQIATTVGYCGRSGSRPLRQVAEQVEVSFLGPPSGHVLPNPGSFQRCASPQHVERERTNMTNAATAVADVTTAGKAKMEIGKRIRAVREGAGKELRECAGLIGVSEATWSGWEKTGCDKLTKLYQIAALFGVAVRSLLPDSIDLTFSPPTGGAVGEA